MILTSVAPARAFTVRLRRPDVRTVMLCRPAVRPRCTNLPVASVTAVTVKTSPAYQTSWPSGSAVVETCAPAIGTPASLTTIPAIVIPSVRVTSTSSFVSPAASFTDGP